MAHRLCREAIGAARRTHRDTSRLDSIARFIIERKS
jgi:hypothetical protein